MARQIEIRFEKGGRFVATLYDELAPQTCSAIWAALPIEGPVRRGAFSGMVMFCWTDVKVEGPENPKCYGLFPGDLGYYVNVHKLPIKNQINFIFGPAVIRDIGGESLVNHFGRITEGSLEELARIGERIWEYGREQVTISRL
ncbi:MAG: DUF3830 family protein [Chloroflexi bacterium]|nr:DUF3830 family protein [Chloroflexota bacterium]